MKTDIETIDKLRALHAQYVQELESSQIKPLSLEVYKNNSKNFVRWIEGDFNPGKKARNLKDRIVLHV